MKKIEKFDYLIYILFIFIIISTTRRYFFKNEKPLITELIMILLIFVIGLRPFLKEKLFIIIKNIIAIGGVIYFLYDILLQ